MKKILPSVLKKNPFFSVFLFIQCLMMLTSFSSYGQVAIIKGKITAADDQSPLVSATVVVKGTTTGVISDFNGDYTLSLRAGTYTIHVSYIGYESQDKEVSLDANSVKTLDISLPPMSILGEEVVVTMQARGQIAAVNQQVRSNQIINVVSEERIRELPDENAAQAISRLPGIHLDGSKVVIRGIESKMNKIMINGIEMPSTESENRATDLGIVSANMLSGIEVFKTLTPDMDANAIGGVVNLRLREAPKDFHYSITAQGSYNSQEKKFGGMKLWGDVSNRFFDNRLGVVLNLNYETRYGGDDWVTMNYNEKESNNIGTGNYMYYGLYLNDQLLSTENIGGSMVVDYVLPKGKLIFSSMLSLSTPEETLYGEDMEPGNQYQTANLTRSKYTTTLLNNSLRLEQQIGIVKLDASLSYVSVNRDYDYNMIHRARYDITNKPFFADSITEAKKLAMGPLDVYNALDTNATRWARYYDTQIFQNKYGESQWLADLNLQVPLRISDNFDVNFKFGGKYTRKDRYYDRNYLIYYYPTHVNMVLAEVAPWLNSRGIYSQTSDWSQLYFPQMQDRDYRPNEGYMNNQPYRFNWVIDKEMMDEMWFEQVNLDPETTKLVDRSEAARFDYWGWESLTSGYVMAEINLGRKLTIIPGVRIEQQHNEYSAPKVEQGTQWYYSVLDTLTKPVDHTNILPHLHVRYRVTNWWDVRFSFNNTLTRPDYNHAIPIIYYHNIDYSNKAGNPFIKPAVSENLDLNFTFYTRKMGLVTVGAYMKNISGVFYMQPTLMKNITDILLGDSSIVAEFPTKTYPALLENSTEFYMNSPYIANVKGIEAEWQSNFSWLPQPFNGIVLNVNYTRVWSETQYMQDRVTTEKIKVPGSLFPKVVVKEIDTSFVNRLLNQANDIANVSLGYDYKGFSARLSFRFQGNVISRIGTRPEENEYTNDIYAYDFVVKQKIPLKFADFEVFFNAINFTNVPNKRYHIYPNLGERTTYERYSGAQFQLGLRLRH